MASGIQLTEPRDGADSSQRALAALEGGFGLDSLPLQPRRRSCAKAVLISAAAAACALVLVLAIVAQHSSQSAAGAPRKVSKVAFGSCTQRFNGPNAIWQQGIIPSQPDAWVWLGDMAYMDMPIFECDDDNTSEQCKCKTHVWAHPPDNCHAGSVQNAQRKVEGVLRSLGYTAFLNFMCPNFMKHGKFPPAGSNNTICPRPILGVYDDHDFGGNNMNGRQLPNRAAIKQVFLDALGEASSSIGRNSLRGIYDRVTLNAAYQKQHQVSVLLLDERYERVPLPCHVRREYCEDDDVHKSKWHKAWCKDFVGSKHTDGSCCRIDDDIALSWCQSASNSEHPDFASACDPFNASFGHRDFAVNGDGELYEPQISDSSAATHESGFCEVLGREQRTWLQGQVSQIDTPVTLVASGSVLFGAPSRQNEPPKHKGYCSGDDWDCYRPAQQNLIAQLARIPGCVIVLTGDYHAADIKRIQPRERAGYAQYYSPPDLAKPIWQVMASGLHTTTTDGLERNCGANDTCCGWNDDIDGLRGPGRACNLFGEPNFGTAHFDWDRQLAILQINRGDGTGVAKGVDGTAIRVTLDLATCSAV